MMRPAGKIAAMMVLWSCCLGAIAATDSADGTNNTTSTSTNINNSGINKRDQQNAELTPQNQPNAAGDRKTLAAVRKTIVHEKSLSLAAHNIKIIVVNGSVTLRGPVNSSDEKRRVEQLVTQVSGVSGVDNELDVKTGM